MRYPDIKSKSDRLVYVPITIEDHMKAQAFKKLAVQDELTIYDLLNQAIDLVFKAHHVDYMGNNQLQLPNFQEGTIQVELKCSHCSNQAVKVGLNLKNNQESCFCKHHFSELPLRYDPKVWRWKT
jgi:hypothetical protein